jgi:CCR4-NOT complex subunit CAF16
VPCCPVTPTLAGGPRSILPALQPGQKLLHIVEEWLRRERDARHSKQQQAATAASGSARQQPPQQQQPAQETAASVVPSRTPFMPNKHLAFFR